MIIENLEYKTLDNNIEKDLQQQLKTNQISKSNREHKKIQSKPKRFADYAKRYTNKRGVEDISKTCKNIAEVVLEEE